MSYLCVVPTPIGHLKDMTFRAIEAIKNADIVLCEDTRVSGKLLNHYEIKKPLRSFHQANEHKKLKPLIDELQSGVSMAMISDAGTPGISDPGYLLIREALLNDIKVEVLPGATAFVPALLLSGFPTDRFYFEGFLPHKKGRQTKLSQIERMEQTVILYESPHRLLKTLKQMSEIFSEERIISISREISKKFEETVRGTIPELMVHFENKKPRGEFVIVIEGVKKPKKNEKIIGQK